MTFFRLTRVLLVMIPRKGQEPHTLLSAPVLMAFTGLTSALRIHVWTKGPVFLLRVPVVAIATIGLPSIAEGPS